MTDSCSPRFESAPGMLLAGVRRHHRLSEVAHSMTQQWQDFMKLRLPHVRGTRAYGAYCGMTDDGFEYLAGVEVDGFDDLPAEVGRVRIPPQQYAVFTHAGNVSQIGSTWERIWREWLPASGYEDAETPPFELYDERFDPATGEGGLEIWFPVRRRAG